MSAKNSYQWMRTLRGSLLPLSVAVFCGGCASIGNRALTSNEILRLAAAEIRQCCLPFTSDKNLAIEKTLGGWRVSAPSACMSSIGASPSRAESPASEGQPVSLAEIEGTAILCVGGGVDLSYDAQGRLTDKVLWQ